MLREAVYMWLNVQYGYNCWMKTFCAASKRFAGISISLCYIIIVTSAPIFIVRMIWPILQWARMSLLWIVVGFFCGARPQTDGSELDTHLSEHGGIRKSQYDFSSKTKLQYFWLFALTINYKQNWCRHRTRVSLLSRYLSTYCYSCKLTITHTSYHNFKLITIDG
jgi:hypothetical protein